jgi:hypothetical protein
MMKRLLINLCFLFAIFPSCIAQQRTPTMGWSSWNAYRVNISARTNEPRKLYVDVNGRTVGLLTYSADSQQTVVVELKKGQNTVRLHNDHERMPDVDYLSVETK